VSDIGECCIYGYSVLYGIAAITRLAGAGEPAGVATWPERLLLAGGCTEPEAVWTRYVCRVSLAAENGVLLCRCGCWDRLTSL
jgi:hypothetical protein